MPGARVSTTFTNAFSTVSSSLCMYVHSFTHSKDDDDPNPILTSRLDMVHVAVVAAPVGAAAAALVTKAVFSARAPLGETRRGVVDADEASFACERVCASDRLMARLGGLGKAEMAHACVTVCGMSGTDACVDACARVACTAAHGVPGWNEKCVKRCASECARGRSGTP